MTWFRSASKMRFSTDISGPIRRIEFALHRKQRREHRGERYEGAFGASGYARHGARRRDRSTKAGGAAFVFSRGAAHEGFANCSLFGVVGGRADDVAPTSALLSE